MSNDIEKYEPKADVFERMERFQSLQAGVYWRALQDFPEEGISKDEVLLLDVHPLGRRCASYRGGARLAAEEALDRNERIIDEALVQKPYPNPDGVERLWFAVK